MQKISKKGSEMPLVVKDNVLINASFNLDLVEQRLILLAIIEARESGKGINANDALTVHASSYMQNFHVERQPAYISLKKPVMTYSRVNLVINQSMKTEMYKIINPVGLVK